MNESRSRVSLARRFFLSRVGAGAAAFGAAFGTVSVAQAQQPSGGGAAPRAPQENWQATRHAEDDWFDQVPATTKHRVFFDSTTSGGIGQALFFARNTFVANTSGYKLTDADLAQVICLRHQSTSFAFTDAMWAKYSAALSERSGDFLDPKTKQVPVINVYLAAGYGELLNNGGVLLDALAKRGVRFAVCSLATRATATLIAQKTGASVDAVFKELTENLVPSGRMVPAGIVAVNRAQERGYTFGYVA